MVCSANQQSAQRVRKIVWCLLRYTLLYLFRYTAKRPEGSVALICYQDATRKSMTETDWWWSSVSGCCQDVGRILRLTGYPWGCAISFSQSNDFFSLLFLSPTIMNIRMQLCVVLESYWNFETQIWRWSWREKISLILVIICSTSSSDVIADFRNEIWINKLSCGGVNLFHRKI